MTLHTHARTLIDAGSHEPALHLLVQHLAAHPTDALAWCLAGETMGNMGRYGEAHAALSQAFAIAPSHLEARIAQAQTLQHEGRPEDAEHAYLRAEQEHPTSEIPPCRLGWLLLRQARHQQARQAFARALRRAPGMVSALAGLAMILEHDGASETAADTLGPYVRTVTPHPMLAFSWGRAMLTLKRGDEALPTLLRALDGADQRADRVNLLHLVGDCLAEQHQHAQAFAHYHQANELRSRDFDGPKHLDAVRTMMRCMPREGLARPSTRDHRSLMVVGVPRSGTSLVETMLSRHPDVAPGGELEAWRHLAIQAGEATECQPWYRYPERLGTATLDDLGRSYARTLHAIDPNARRVVDKMPNNVLHLALAAWVMPDTVVVHCVRDPADTAWSCFRLPFQEGLAFSTRLSGLAHWIQAERELMAHFERTLSVPIVRVQYERLVRDPASQLRPVFEAAGLPWHPSVATHSGTQRTVATASYNQVRQPLYTRAVGRSKPYHALMHEFFETWHQLQADAASRAA